MEKLTDTQKIKIMLESICGNTQEIINGADNDATVVSENFKAIYNKLLSIEKKIEQNENKLKELWKSVCVAYINSSKSTKKDGGENWADYIIERYKTTYKIK